MNDHKHDDEHDEDRHEENRQKLEEALRAQLPIERRLLVKSFKRKNIKTFPYRAAQEANQGSAAFIPSYRPYTKDDIALLLFEARLNGGLLPVKVRMALLKPHMVPMPQKPGHLMKMPDHSTGTRNRLKRLRKKFRG